MKLKRCLMYLCYFSPPPPPPPHYHNTGKEEREFVNKCIKRLQAGKTTCDNKIIIASHEPPTTNNEIPTTYMSSRLERLKTECSLYQMVKNLTAFLVWVLTPFPFVTCKPYPPKTLFALSIMCLVVLVV